MQQFEKTKGWIRGHVRLILGSIIFFFGAIFMFIPFIPLGYIFLAIGAFLLTPTIPALKKLVDYIEKKDKTNKVKEAEERVDGEVKRRFERKDYERNDETK